MLNAMGSLVRHTLFAIAILIAGQWVEWEGHTLSSHVNHALQHAMNSNIMDRMKDWSRQLTQDAQVGASKIIRKDQIQSRSSAPQREAGEDISSSERKKLRELIQELNGKRN